MSAPGCRLLKFRMANLPTELPNPRVSLTAKCGSSLEERDVWTFGMEDFLFDAFEKTRSSKMYVWLM